MATPAIHWYEGMFLRPQHFQAAQRYEAGQRGHGAKWDFPLQLGTALPGTQRGGAGRPSARPPISPGPSARRYPDLPPRRRPLDRPGPEGAARA